MTDGEERTIGVAVAIPEPYGPELERRRASYGDPLASSVPAHITLVPPTRVPVSELEEIERHLRDAARDEHRFDIHLRGTGTFRPVSPVVFVALAEGIGDCERLEYKVRSGPLAVDRPFPYHPHVTVAHHLTDAVLDRAFKELASYEATFPVHAFSLYEHGLDCVWRPRRHFPFGGRAYRP
ncbi:MAG: 2'-5' RNA ligase family protein [Actinoallomurus sp.]